MFWQKFLPNYFMTSILLDKFVDRLMIPVTDKQGSTIGYTGRVLNSINPNRPKYLNTSDTKWFQKGKIWFGWQEAVKFIRQQKYAILVEGNMDVITCHQYNIENVLASQGTSFTKDQIKLLKTVTDTVYIAFDNDKAGTISSDKMFIAVQEFNIEIKKLLIPSEFKDLDEYLKSDKISIKDFEIINYLDYILLREIKNLTSNNSETQRESIANFLKMLSYTNSITVSQYLNKLSELTKLNKTALEQFQQEINRIVPSIFKDDLDKSNTNNSPNLNQTKSLTELQRVLVTWERLCAIYVAGKLSNEYQSKIYWLFLLLKSFLIELEGFKTLEEYISEKLDILTLVFENIEFDKQSQTRLWTYLTFGFIEQNWTRILLSPELKNYYNQIKKNN